MAPDTLLDVLSPSVRWIHRGTGDVWLVFSVPACTGHWARVCAPDDCGSCLPGRFCPCPAGTGLHRASCLTVRPSSPTSVILLVQPGGGNICLLHEPGRAYAESYWLAHKLILRGGKEAKDGRPNPMTKSKTLLALSSLMLSISPLGGPAGELCGYLLVKKIPVVFFHPFLRHFSSTYAFLHLHINSCIYCF